MTTRGEKYAEGKFAHPLHPKDGYPLPECTKDPRARRLLEFLVPIFYPQKPTQVTVSVGNTIFGAYIGKREVDWTVVMKDTVRQLLTKIGKSEPMPICPCLLHLYFVHNAIQRDDK